MFGREDKLAPIEKFFMPQAQNGPPYPQCHLRICITIITLRTISRSATSESPSQPATSQPCLPRTQCLYKTLLLGDQPSLRSATLHARRISSSSLAASVKMASSPNMLTKVCSLHWALYWYGMVADKTSSLSRSRRERRELRSILRGPSSQIPPCAFELIIGQTMDSRFSALLNYPAMGLPYGHID